MDASPPGPGFSVLTNILLISTGGGQGIGQALEQFTDTTTDQR